MSKPIKMAINYRSELVNDSSDPNVNSLIEVIEFNRVILGGEKDKVESFTKDAFEPLEAAEAIVHRIFPNGGEPWNLELTPDDPEWEGRILVYHDKEIL